MKFKLSNKTYLLLEWIILFLLGFSQYMSFSLISLLLTLFLGIIMCLVKIDLMLVLLFSALPFFNLFNGKIGQFSFYYVFIFIFIYKYYFYKNKRISKNKLLFFIWLFIIRITSADFKVLITWSLLILVLILTYNEDILVRQSKQIIKGISVSMIISSAWGYIYLLTGKSIYTVGQVYLNGTITTRFGGLIGDSVFFAQFCAILIAANLVICYVDKKNITENIIFCLLLTIFDLLSYSKTGFLLIGFIYISYFIASIYKNAKYKKTVYKSIIITLVIIILVVYLINYVLNHLDNIIIQNYLLRFTSSDLLTGRNIVSEHYIELLEGSWKYLFFAMPQSLYSKPFPISSFTEINTAHNIYLETICAFGLISSIILFIIILYILIKRLTKNKNLFSCLPLFVMVFSGWVLHGHYEFQYYFLIALALSMLSYNDFVKINK